jgi:hypothetical protein
MAAASKSRELYLKNGGTAIVGLKETLGRGSTMPSPCRRVPLPAPTNGKPQAPLKIAPAERISLVLAIWISRPAS